MFSCVTVIKSGLPGLLADSVLERSDKHVINTANPFKIINSIFLFFKHYCVQNF